MTPKEVQLGEIRQQIADWRKDVASGRKNAAEARKLAEEHDAEAAHAEEMARRWEVVHDAVRFGVVPNLDGYLDPSPHPASEQCTCKTCDDRRWREAYGTSSTADNGDWARGEVPF